MTGGAPGPVQDTEPRSLGSCRGRAGRRRLRTPQRRGRRHRSVRDAMAALRKSGGGRPITGDVPCRHASRRQGGHCRYPNVQAAKSWRVGTNGAARLYLALPIDLFLLRLFVATLSSPIYPLPCRKGDSRLRYPDHRRAARQPPAEGPTSRIELVGLSRLTCRGYYCHPRPGRKPFRWSRLTGEHRTSLLRGAGLCGVSPRIL